MTAQDRIAEYLSALESGKTVNVCTATRVTQIRPKHVERFRSAGMEILRASGDSMYMANGRKYVCIDYCRIVVTD